MALGRKRILIQLCTGGGKTAIASYMLKGAAARGNPSWFNCNRTELIEQTSAALDKFEVSHGIVSAGYPARSEPLIQVCSVPSLKSRMHKIRRPKLIFWDECRFIGAQSWDKIFNEYPDSYHIGLDATPIRTGSGGLGKYFEVIIKGPSMSWLIERGYLSRYRAFAPTTVDLSDVRIRAGDMVKEELSVIMDKPMITGSAVAQYLKHANEMRNIVFTVSIQHSKHVVEEFLAAGIPAAHLDGGTEKHIRAQTLAKFNSGEIKVLSNCELFTFGFDAPATECITLLRPTNSLAMYLQMVGRGMRVHPDKSEVIILDHSNLLMTHGFPDDDRQWSLEYIDKKKAKKPEMSVKICPSCFCAMKPGKALCIECGGALPVSSREISQEDGDLEEITREKLIKKKTMQSARTIEELRAFGVENNYHPGWADKIFNARKLKTTKMYRKSGR